MAKMLQMISLGGKVLSKPEIGEKELLSQVKQQLGKQNLSRSIERICPTL